MSKAVKADELIRRLLNPDALTRNREVGITDDHFKDERKALTWAKTTQELLRSVPSHPQFKAAWDVSSELFSAMMLNVRLLRKSR